jgi:hypothetical protein
MYWAWNEGIEGRDYKETSKKACDAGTFAHAMVEADLKKQEFKFPEDTPTDILGKAETAYLAWLEWRDIVDFKVLDSEKPLVSEKHKYGGTLDIAAVKKKTSIVDLKTSNAIYPDHLCQISAYGQLWNEHYPDNPIDAYYLLRLGKEDGSFHYNYWPSLPEAWEAFQCALKLHELHKVLKKK